MKPKVKKWFPLEHIPEEIHFEAVHDDYEGVRVLLRGKVDKSSMLRLSFDFHFSYRVSDKNMYLENYSNLDINEYSIFQVENSSYLAWFHMESLDIHDRDIIDHVLTTTPTKYIDVLCSGLPRVEWLN